MVFLTSINLSGNELQNAIIQPLAVAPQSPKLGQIYCNSSTSKIMWYNGSEWKTVGVVVESAATNGKIIVDGVEMTVYDLPIASANVLGGVKVGEGLSIDSNGVLSATKLASVDWDGVTNKPTKLSEFENDEIFIDNTVSNLTNYYLKAETYTKNEITSLLSTISTMNIEKVSVLPSVNISSSTIYLVPKTNAQLQNVYDEYIYISSKWEKIGNTEIDLSNYLKKTDDVSNTIVSFSQNGSRVLPSTGDMLGVAIGKIIKYLYDLKNVAFTGNYNDLSGLPTIIKKYSGTISTTESDKVFNISGANTILNILLKDSVTKEMVFGDYVINGNSVTIDFSSNPTNIINVEILYI